MLDSFKECKSDGGQIAKFKTDDEVTDIRRLLEFNGGSDIRLGLLSYINQDCWDLNQCDSVLRWWDMDDFDTTVFTVPDFNSWSVENAWGRCTHLNDNDDVWTDQCDATYDFVCEFSCSDVMDTTCADGRTPPPDYFPFADGIFYRYNVPYLYFVDAVGNCASDGAVLTPAETELDYHAAQSLALMSDMNYYPWLGLVYHNPSITCSNDCDGKLHWLDGTPYATPAPNYFFTVVEMNSGHRCTVLERHGDVDDRGCTLSGRPFSCRFDCTGSQPVLSDKATCSNGDPIPTGYFDAGGKLYKHVSAGTTFTNAVSACDGVGGQLAVISDNVDYRTVLSITCKFD